MVSIFRSGVTQRHLVWNLAKRDFSSRYLGSVLGVLWAFLIPLLNLTVMWFAFEFGLKASPQQGIPFVLWLVTGMFPWLFFSDAVQSATGAILEKAFLVKKIVFQVELLPLIKIIAAIIPFIFLVGVMLIMFVIYGFYPDLYWLQIAYYSICLFALVASIAGMTSAVVVFYRDLNQVVSMVLQVGFWGTPIFWSPDLLPERFYIINFLNPVSYIVTGFRESLISKTWFWENINQTIYFWILVFILSLCSQMLFRKLRPHFADML